MDAFRYEQFCPLARATEILGHRWVMLILRELSIGPQRFSDLRRRLPGLSSSLLTDRLGHLEEQGVVARRTLDPPAASTVYALTDDGHALRPALIALTRWGARFLTNVGPEDHVEPEWLGLGCEAFAKAGPTPERRIELRPYQGDRRAVLRVAGGPDGTHAIEDSDPVDLAVEAPVMVIMGLMNGLIPAEAALGMQGVQIEGARDALADLPRLFDFSNSTELESVT